MNYLLLVITIIIAYSITNDDLTPRKKKQAASHWPSLLAGTGDYFAYNTYVIVYLRCSYAVLAILCTGLPITITIARKRLTV